MEKKTAATADASDSSVLGDALSNEGQALVLSGGGARAAYQVGCLRALALSLPDYRPRILTGVSAGAINATHLAAFQGSWGESVEALVRLWQAMRTEQVYRTDLGHLAGRMAHWGCTLLAAAGLAARTYAAWSIISRCAVTLKNNCPPSPVRERYWGLIATWQRAG